MGANSVFQRWYQEVWMKMEGSKIEGLAVIRKGVPFIMVPQGSSGKQCPAQLRRTEGLATIPVSPLFTES